MDKSSKLNKTFRNQETVVETPIELAPTPSNNNTNQVSSSFMQSTSNFQSTMSSNQPISNNKLSIKIKKSFENGRPSTPNKLNILKKSTFPQKLMQNQNNNQMENQSINQSNQNNQNLLPSVPELTFPETSSIQGNKESGKSNPKKSILTKLAAVNEFKSTDTLRTGRTRLKRRSSVMSSPSSPQSTSRVARTPTAELTTYRKRERESNLFLASNPVINTPLCLYNPLNLAVKASRRDVIKVLLDHEANPNIKDGTGVSPYNRALMKRAAAAIYERDKMENEEKQFRDMLGDTSKSTMVKRFLKKYLCCCCKTCFTESNELEENDRQLKESSKSILLDEEASLKAPNPQHQQESNKMKIRDKWISTLSQPIKERKDDRQITNIQLANKVVDDLATSENVQQRRSTFGLWLFFKEGIIFLALYILLLSFTSAFFDYGTQNVYIINIL